MGYKIKFVDFVGTTTRHVFSICIGRKDFHGDLLTYTDECNMPEYRIIWKGDEPDDIDESDLINDLFDTL